MADREATGCASASDTRTLLMVVISAGRLLVMMKRKVAGMCLNASDALPSAMVLVAYIYI
ncbi:MAG: hypothetical protein IJ511_08110 [Bacteroides sp.]|nr:hypothetical protein [Bacteroides sp.]